MSFVEDVRRHRQPGRFLLIVTFAGTVANWPYLLATASLERLLRDARTELQQRLRDCDAIAKLRA